MPQSLSIRWRPSEGVTIARAGERAVSIEVSEHIGTRRETPSPALADALMCLNGGADESVMLDALGDPGAAAVLYFNLGRLRHYGLLVAEVWRAGRLMATLLPRARNFDPVLKAEPSREWQLSRFAYLRRDGNDLLLECPEAPCVLQIQDIELVAWIAEAAGPVTAAPGTPKAEASALLGQLGFFVDPGEEEAPGQRTWEFHDRLFHRKARHFDDFQPHGGTYRFRGRFPSEPAIPPAYDGETARLPVPASRTGRPLREVMEARRSRRDMDDDRPVTRDQVAELLYRVARVRETIDSGEQECLLRSYPSGGAIHELEFYLAVRAADGLTPGFYHYGGADHALTLLEGAHQPAADMLADCANAWGQPELPPQCLVVLASRLPRLAWKYEGIAYKISLMNAGVALQCLYLVAEDMGLNGSAAGSGRPELFSAATQASSWEETSIAEFGFGRPPDA